MSKRKTHWKEVRAMEEAIDDNDPKFIHEFIDHLAKHKLLDRYMLTRLCNSTILWQELHYFAGMK